MRTKPTTAAVNLPGLIHESTRTAIATNRDSETGATERSLRNSRLLMHWEGGEVRVRFESSAIKLDGHRPARPMRGAR